MSQRFHRFERGLFVFLALAAGCGGGGAASSPPAPTSSAAAAAGHGLAAKVSIVIPARSSASAKRAPRYVSSGTQSLVFTLTSGSFVDATQIVNVYTDPECAANPGGGVACSVAVLAPPGADGLTVAAYDQTNGSGDLISSGTVGLPAPDLTGAAVPVALTMIGKVASVALTLPNPFLPGVVATQPMQVAAKDASGATIIGSDPFDQPIVLGATASGFTFTPAVVTSPATMVTVAYNGQSQPGVVITASVGLSSVPVAVASPFAPAAQPTATPTPSPTPTPTVSPTPTASPTVTPTATATPSPSPSPTANVVIKGRRP
jgi:hypothetical protein